MTIEGTVREILGYPTLFLIRDARIPAVNAPMNAAAAGGIADRSTSSSLSVFGNSPDHRCRCCQPYRTVKHNRKAKYPAETCYQVKYYPHSYWH